MKLMKQPNRWSCLLTSFAMVLNIEIEDLIKEIGHDGSKLIWEHLPEPRKRQSFHVQEFILAAYKRRKAVIPFEIYPLAGPSPAPQIREVEKILNYAISTKQINILQLERVLALIKGLDENVYKVMYPESNEKIFDQLLNGSEGVLTGESLSGNSHAVAWDGEKIYDPCGPFIRKRDEFVPNTFYMIKSFWPVYDEMIDISKDEMMKWINNQK